MKNTLIFILLACLPLLAVSQNSQHDTVIVQLANHSKLVFTMGDPADISLLEHYDFQALFDDILKRLEEQAIAAGELKDDGEDEFTYDAFGHDENAFHEDDHLGEDEYYVAYTEEDHDDDHAGKRNYRRQNFFGSANMDFGINNYLDNSGFPGNNHEQYAVRPWGSWYVALNSVYHTRVNEHFRFQWGIGISAHNFKFQDDRTVLSEGPSTVLFTRDEADADFIKSKLTVNHINASIVPVVEFGRHRDKPRRWHSHYRDFRVGLGVYGGYRIGSYTKQVYEIDNDREKERTRDNFYLHNLRYGVRLQLGIYDTDFFINYDLSNLFADDRGPQLNVYSFGIIF